jgi:group I intron endonuclease
MIRQGVIYKVTSIKTGHYLFGSSIDFKRRVNCYKSQLRLNKYRNPILQSLYNKYGLDNIKFEIVKDNINEDILTIIEDIWIGANKSLRNDNPKGMNLKNAFRIKCSEETKQRIRESKKGIITSWNKGIPMPQAQKDLLSKVKKAKCHKMPNEIKLKLSLATKGRPKSEEWKKKISIPIIQYNLNNEFIKEWDSAKSIGEFFNVDSTTFIRCCKKKQKTAYGYKWQYKDEKLQKNKYILK